MKYVPHAWATTAAGILLTIRGLVTQNLPMNIIGDITAAIGLIWLFFAWDKLMNHVKAEKRRERRVDKLETVCGNTGLIARAADQKADEAKAAARSGGRHVKGYIRRGDQIINFDNRMEA